MNICIIGTGYVGLVAGACFAETGNNVICVDKDVQKITQLKKNIIPIYEPGLNVLIENNVSKERLSFTSDIDNAIKQAEICIIAVGTPQNEDGSTNLKYIYEVAESIGKAINDYKIIITKSTIPVGTSKKIEQIIKSFSTVDFDIVFNPEFLKQGNAVNDFLMPDRIIVGTQSEKATNIIKNLYKPYVRTGNPIITMDIESAEMTKYAANSFLALKISYINEIANICEKVGADSEMVRFGISTDKRIGAQFLFPGLGYGGSCFPKDIKSLIKTATEQNCECEILKSIEKVNQKQRKNFINKILNKMGNDLTDITIAIWGLSFKPKTNDIREAPAITIIEELLKRNANIQVYDPKAIQNTKLHFKDQIEYKQSEYEALQNADCLLLLTEWNEFRNPNFEKIKNLMRQPIIFDGRNLYNKYLLTEKGFFYEKIG